MHLPQPNWSRRKFVARFTGAGALVLLNPQFSWAFEGADPKITALVAKSMGIDTHNHIDVPLVQAELPGPAQDMAGEMKKSGLSAICMTFAVDYKQPLAPGESYSRFTAGLDAMDRLLVFNNIKRALNLAGLEAAHKEQKPAVIQSVEGCHFLEGDAAKVEEAYNRGLRVLGLLHDNDALQPLGDVYTNPPQYGGLTKLGSDVIKECERLGILVDLAHGSNDMVNAALKVATKPVLISHTGLDTQLGQNPFMAKMMKPRLISQEQAKIVANAGGVIGVWTHLAETPLEYAQNIRAMADVVGIDHVCIGTDTKLTPAYHSPNEQWGKQGSPEKPKGKDVGTSSEGNNHPKKEENKNGERIGERTNLAWAGQTTGFYYAVTDALLKTGFTEAEIIKISSGNFCRLFDATTKH
ncbi:peptidase M19 [Flavobacterium akiainvivens]|uniref:Peptidase M19 n=1 Tax=Flavobacterium akiainvivens TaxID=1202724 RepID=A0A0M9VJC5_9FLAO|nr:membrane dipeptidase [Flavobacterium akiainvivens]KOS07589.1 peptidase M19 [Flavobacterium akiainvivens]SFQ22303.1 Zn-dependent dipeptidase, dipeptidase homolog [Flavobacterium akiainvivens]